MNRRRRRRGFPATIAVAGAVAAALAMSCTDSPTPAPAGSGPGVPAGSVVGTVPVEVSPGGSLPAPVGVSDLDGVKARLRLIGEVREPVALTSRPNTTNLYVAEQGGRVKRINVERQVDGAGRVIEAAYTVEPRPILDLTGAIAAGGERGLLGLAFSAEGQRLYVYFTAREGAVTVDEYRIDAETIDVRSRRTLLAYEHPLPNHNGGQLVFGPDGFLYVGIGDGGGGGDPKANGQNPKTPYGKILRIDPSKSGSGRPYAIPADNPFADGSRGAPEVWAYGLRNPWRFSFDTATKDLWIGDVGQNAWEEIDFLPHRDGGAGRGANLGWNRMEGSHPFRGGTPPEDHVPPIHDYATGDGTCSVVGGYVYRGATNPTWGGAYFWTDYCEGEIHVLLRGAGGRVEDRGTGLRVADGGPESGGSITSFGQDLDGELYALSAAGGIYKIEAAT